MVAQHPIRGLITKPRQKGHLSLLKTVLPKTQPSLGQDQSCRLRLARDPTRSWTRPDNFRLARAPGSGTSPPMKRSRLLSHARRRIVTDGTQGTSTYPHRVEHGMVSTVLPAPTTMAPATCHYVHDRVRRQWVTSIQATVAMCSPEL